jgi:hypothetical protein
MPNKEPPPSSSRFAFYHQNEALLFQFLVHECLRAHSLLRKKPCPILLVQIVGNLEVGCEKWQAPIGHLPRLMHYCALLYSHFNQSLIPYSKQLKIILDRAYSAAKKYESSADRGEEACGRLYKILREAITTFIKILLERLPEYRDDASVLYFLLRHQEQVDALFRQPFVKKTFSLFFPEGVGQAYLFFAEKFTKRGFNHLIPAIEQQLKQLEKDE